MTERTMDIREVVKQELTALGITPYRLWVLCGGRKIRGTIIETGRVNRDVLFRWLGGRTTIGADSLGQVLDALELEIKRKRGARRGLRALLAAQRQNGAARRVRKPGKAGAKKPK